MSSTIYTNFFILSILIGHLITFSVNANKESLGRKDIIDYKAFYSGTTTLETARLILRQIGIDDVTDMFQFTSNKEVETWDPIDKTIDDTYHFIETLQQKYKAKEPSLWGLVDKESKKLIGYCGFTSLQLDLSIAELEYALDKPYWNQGLMSEALEAILAFSFNTLKLNRILAFVPLYNPRSAKFLLKMGFAREGLHREAGYTEGAFYDLESFALLREEYLTRARS